MTECQALQKLRSYRLPLAIQKNGLDELIFQERFRQMVLDLCNHLIFNEQATKRLNGALHDKEKGPSKDDLRVKKPPPLPSQEELIAEARALGEDDMANAMEKIRYLESPKGQKALERREKRISWL